MWSANAHQVGWPPLDPADFAAMSIISSVEVAVAILVIHIVHHRSWLPYDAIIPQLVAWTGLAGIATTATVAMRYGLWGTTLLESGGQLGCNMQAGAMWAGGGALVFCAFLRVYRYHSVLVRHNGLMWPILLQLVALLVPFSLFHFLLMALLGFLTFDPYTRECEPESAVPEGFAIAVLSLFAVASSILTFRLRVAYAQAPEEFHAAVITSTILVITVLTLPIIHVLMDGDRAGRRRMVLVAAALAGVGVFTPPLVQPICGFLWDKEKYERSGYYGTGKAQRSKDDEDRCRAADEKFSILVPSPAGSIMSGSCSAMARFHYETRTRDDVEDYFLRQASTMSILATYVRKGAPAFIPLSDECLATTLTIRASSAFIFGRARNEVLEMVESAVNPSRANRSRNRKPFATIEPPPLNTDRAGPTPYLYSDSSSDSDRWSYYDGGRSYEGECLSGDKSWARRASSTTIARGTDESRARTRDDISPPPSSPSTTDVLSPLSLRRTRLQSSPTARPRSGDWSWAWRGFSTKIACRTDESRAHVRDDIPPPPSSSPSTTDVLSPLSLRRTRSQSSPPARPPSPTDGWARDNNESERVVSPVHFTDLQQVETMRHKQRRRLIEPVARASDLSSVGEVTDDGGEEKGDGMAGATQMAGSSVGMLVKSLPGTHNIRAAFGLRRDANGSADNGDEPTSREVRLHLANTTRNTSSTTGTGGDGRNLVHATTPTIVNPIFGDGSRSIGRRPGGKVRPVATRWDFASHSRNRLVARRSAYARARAGWSQRGGVGIGDRGARVVGLAGGGVIRWESRFFTLSEMDEQDENVEKKEATTGWRAV